MQDFNLDDINKTVFCIPYNAGDEMDDGQEQDFEMPPSLYKERELEGGRELRFLAYREAWRKCMDRMKKIIQDLQISYSNAVVQEVKSSYTDVHMGLPYPELPVVSIINPSLGSTFLEGITMHLKNAEPRSQSPDCIVTHLYPGDFPNVSAGVKSIIAGFMDKVEILEQARRRPATSLANYDIKLLVAWYQAWLNSVELEKGSPRPNLVILLHEFEQFDTFVMQDIFYICSGFISQLPLVFLLSMSSPTPNYLNATYPRATTSLLRVRGFTAPSGLRIIQEIISKTFFDVEFEPDIMIGPAVLEYLQDYFMRYHPSIDSIFTILQIAHLKHFTSDPLTILVRATPSFSVLSEPTSLGFVNALSSRLVQRADRENVNMDGKELPGLHSIVEKVHSLRQGFNSQLRGLRIAFGAMLRIQTFLESQGYKGLDWSANLKKGGLCDAMINLLRGNLARDIKTLVITIRKLNREELRSILDNLYTFFSDMPAYIRTEEKGARALLVQLKSSISADDSGQSDLSVTLSTWLGEYLEQRLIPLEESALWDVWYTGLSPFPSELLNPSERASVIAGLLQPHAFAEGMTTDGNSEVVPKDIWELPDTSILFRRYLNSGKMVNVYDWFESFKTVLDSQRTHLIELSTPKKGRKKTRGKLKPPESTNEDDEKWNIEVQARFIRALQELDYLGFIKHTGRKADHLIRTVFDVEDAE